MRALQVLVLVAMIGGVLIGRDSAVAVPLCGQVTNVKCIGCTDSYPPDDTCYCGPNHGSCCCLNSTGQVQTGTIVECQTGPFSYVYQQCGPTIHSSLISSGLCAVLSKCTTSAGGHANCAQLIGGSCVSGGTTACDWRWWDELWSYEEGEPCCE
jgi:hypothetical protein